MYMYAAAKSLQSCPTLCDPIDGSPPGSPVPGILQARTLEWVAMSFSNAWKWKVKVKSLSRIWLLATPWTAAYQAPPSMGFSRQEYWSGVLLPSPYICVCVCVCVCVYIYISLWSLYKESWALKNICFWTVVLEKTLESPWTTRRSNQSILKEISPEYSLGRTDAEAETPILWPPDAKNWLIWKDPDAGKDWRWEEKGTTQDEMVGWHHWQCTWVLVNSGSWWWTGRHGLLQSMGSQRVGHDWETELYWWALCISIY